jgi:hypothetical protein
MAADRVLSLLRERFEDDGEGGTASGAADDIGCVSALRFLAFRRRARSLCSLKADLSALKATASGRGGRIKLEGEMVTVGSGG